MGGQLGTQTFPNSELLNLTTPNAQDGWVAQENVLQVVRYLFAGWKTMAKMIAGKWDLGDRH